MTEEELDLEYLRERLQLASFVPVPWDGEDKNLAAFRSKSELITWYCQPPGAEGEPYRDRGFYCRELAMLSMWARPKVIAEFGTSLGIGTCLLRWLNPQAHLVTVDSADETFLPGDTRVKVGHLARLQKIHCTYAHGNSQEYRRSRSDVGLCFIDADHSYEAVVKDSETAWKNRADHVHADRWAIAWHDHNSRHPGVLQAVAEFCKDKGVELQSRSDSDTVWVMGEK